MAVECTTNVGFHSNFGRFRQSGHSKTPLRFAIINGMPLNPTYDPKKNITNLARFAFLSGKKFRCVSPAESSLDSLHLQTFRGIL